MTRLTSRIHRLESHRTGRALMVVIANADRAPRCKAGLNIRTAVTLIGCITILATAFLVGLAS